MRLAGQQKAPHTSRVADAQIALAQLELDMRVPADHNLLFDS